MNGKALVKTTEFDKLTNAVCDQFVSESSARVYRVTFDAWLDWTQKNGIDPLTLNYSTISAFLGERNTTKASKQRELSALRTLAKTLSILDYDNLARKAAYDSIKMLKVRSTGDSRQNERDKRALSPSEADKMLRIWKDDSSTRAIRNRALIAVLLLAGLRREELTALTWQDIDLENGVILVRHGKGDKARESALYGREAIDALQAWQAVQPDGYKTVFVTLRKGGMFIADKAMSTNAVWNVVTETAELAEIGHVKPHDLRRTLVTELLETGSPVHHAQQQAGHATSATTLDNYAGRTDARERRKSAKVRYG